MKYEIRNGQLFRLNYNGSWIVYQCPFNLIESRLACGEWCPHFDFQEEKRQIAFDVFEMSKLLHLTCGGIERIIKIEK